MPPRLDPSTDRRVKPGLLAAIEQRKKRGAPISVPYDPLTAIEICEKLASGQGLSIQAICDNPDNGFPTYQTVRYWLASETDFALRYARARAQSAEPLEEKALAVAADERRDPNCRRIEVDTLKWAASKRNPGKYGDKLDLTVSGSLAIQPVLDTSQLSYEELAVLEKLLAKARPAPVMPVIEHVPISQIPDTLSDDNAT